MIEREGSIILIFDPVYRGGCWILPGGGAELDETVNQAVEREVFEETGLVVKTQEICSIREIWEPEKDFPEMQAVRKSLEIFFVCQYISGEIDIHHHLSVKRDGIPRIKDCRWIPVDHLPELIDGYPLHPLDFFHRFRSGQILRVPLGQIFLTPLDSR